MKPLRPSNARERLLDAAETVVNERGVSAMTLEAIAAQAKVSKGGLLYHFPSKEAVVLGMVTRMVAMIEERFAAELASEPPGKGRHARTLLRLMMDTGSGSLFPQVQKVASPLRASMVDNPEMLEPIRRFFRKVYQGMIDDGLPPNRSWLILATLDGLKFWRVFDLLQPSASELKGLRLLLTEIIDKS